LYRSSATALEGQRIATCVISLTMRSIKIVSHMEWMLCRRNVANLMKQTKGFTPAPVIAPIGAHVIGYTRDGTVPVIKDLRVMDPNQYVLGYKGYMAGDAATIPTWTPTSMSLSIKDIWLEMLQP
jgi:hypothetical protein